jgi:hypothetical protein
MSMSLTVESVSQRGVLATDELSGVREASIGVVFPFPNLNLSNGGVTALVVLVADEFGFEEADEVGFVGGGASRGRNKFIEEDNGARGEGVGGYAFVSNNKSGRACICMVAGDSRGGY